MLQVCRIVTRGLENEEQIAWIKGLKQAPESAGCSALPST
jgi:hypothetical protein